MFRPREETGQSYDYEYDYDHVDRAPGYDVYSGDARKKRDNDDVPCYEEPEFATTFTNSCSIVYSKSCKVDYVDVVSDDCGQESCRHVALNEGGKCSILFQTQCYLEQRPHVKG